MQLSAGGGLAKNPRGLRGNEAANAGREEPDDVDVERDSWSSIILSPARAKQPAPMDTLALRHREMRRVDAACESEAAMWPEEFGGRVLGL